MFVRSGSVWSEQQKLTASDGAAADKFGYSVSLSSDGSTALIGAPYKNVGSNSDQGAAYLFVRSGSVWSEQQKQTASDGAAYDNFGISVFLSSDGRRALIGANSNAVYVFGIDCNSGQYDNGVDCTPCSAGSYQPSTGQTSCLSCAAGSSSRLRARPRA